jgi:DNA modification methylase
MLLSGDARHIPLADESVHCVITSPPYWYLRDYGVPGQIGLEPSPAQYLDTIVQVFREVWRVLRPDGTLWCNLGDTYASGGRGGGGSYMAERGDGSWQRRSWVNGWRSAPSGLKHKDMVGIPWRVAFALQDDGWYLRSDIIWSKPNPMPESVSDRPTKAHEYLFLLAKQPHYYYDAEAIREPASGGAHPRGDGLNPKARAIGANSRELVARDPEHAGRPMKVPSGWDTGPGAHDTLRGNGRYKQNPSFSQAVSDLVAMRNRRTVWEIASEPFTEAHFATFPCALVEPCILAGTSARGCCPKCGAPWRRVVERGATDWQGRVAAGAALRGGAGEGQRRLHGDGCSHDLGGRGSLTTGWQPTCRCDAGEPVPCTVFDPFSGAGTTGLVASRLGRRYVGLELSREYCLMAQKRIRGDAPLLHEATAAAEPQALRLFDLSAAEG